MTQAGNNGALQEDAAVSNEEDGLVQTAAQAAESQEGQLEDFHGFRLTLRLVDPSVAKKAVRVVGVPGYDRQLEFHLKRVVSNGRHQTSSSSMPRLILFNARPWKMPAPSGKTSSEGGETVDPVAKQMFVVPRKNNQRGHCHVQR